ncbi:MAG: hypothetical protein ABW047_02945 [Nitrospiraceae bacterium]
MLKNDQLEKLIHALTTHRVLLMAHQVLLLRLGVSQQEYEDAIQGCIQHADLYSSKIHESLGLPWKRPRKKTEKEKWEALGLEYLWDPSTVQEPEEDGPTQP